MKLCANHFYWCHSQGLPTRSLHLISSCVTFLSHDYYAVKTWHLPKRKAWKRISRNCMANSGLALAQTKSAWSFWLHWNRQTANIFTIHAKCSEISCTDARQQPPGGISQETARCKAIQETDLLETNGEGPSVPMTRQSTGVSVITDFDTFVKMCTHPPTYTFGSSTRWNSPGWRLSQVQSL